MNNSEKLLKMLSSLVENGILTSQDVKKEILTNIKFQKDNLIEKLQVVSREEFEVLKKLVQKQEKQIEKLKRKKIIKKAKRS
jgi:BMFP domain-containing protein YqiC|tara:strand:- start:518 stop:763 length:246 start_codon:yes stop_codon:yes gene_type:complete